MPDLLRSRTPAGRCRDVLLLVALALAGCAAVPQPGSPAAAGEEPAPEFVPLYALLADPVAYAGRRVITSGSLRKLGRSATVRWGFELIEEPDGPALVCYELNWHPRRFGLAQQILRQAEVAGEPVVLGGRIEDDGRLELDWIGYKDFQLQTGQTGIDTAR